MSGYDFYTGTGAAGMAQATALLEAHHHGTLLLWNQEANQPEQTFMHYAWRPEPELVMIEGHLANTNPMLKALAENPQATFMVSGPSAYVPSHWSSGNLAVPTSYYSWVQARVDVRLISDADGIIGILERMLERLQPEGEHPQMRTEPSRWKAMLGAITGLEMRVTGLRSRFKYGQNRPVDFRMGIHDRLIARGQGQDAAVAQAVLAHLPPDQEAGK